MISRPKTLPSTATVADARPGSSRTRSVRTALVVEAAATPADTREDVAGEDDGAAVAALASSATGGPLRTTPAEFPRSNSNAAGTDRLAVVDPDGTLRGLACLSRSHGQLCTDPR